jgi:aminoglycoside 3-N-acetyltransferase
VGNSSDRLVRSYSLTDPLQPLKTLLKEDPFVLTVGVELDSVSVIHMAEQHVLPRKYLKERALAMASTGPVWVEVLALGCSVGFQKLATHISQGDTQEANIGSAIARLYPMKKLIATAERVLDEDPMALACGRAECLNCEIAGE